MGSMVSLVALFAVLVLALSSLAAYRLPLRKIVRYGVIWAVVFVAVTLVFLVVAKG